MEVGQSVRKPESGQMAQRLAHHRQILQSRGEGGADSGYSCEVRAGAEGTVFLAIRHDGLRLGGADSRQAVEVLSGGKIEVYGGARRGGRYGGPTGGWTGLERRHG